ncbi:MAG: SRPBCC family protein [Woeseia sp.]
MNMQAKANHDQFPAQEYGVVTAPDTVRLERLLPGPIERVWSYLTESDKRGQWLASGEMELRVDGRVEHVFSNSTLTGHDDAPPSKYAAHAAKSTMEGRITACEPPRLLAYAWGKSSHVTFELSRQSDKVRLVLTHSRLPTRDEMISVASGWHAHVGILIDRLNGRQPASFWPTHTRLEAEYEERIAVN